MLASIVNAVNTIKAAQTAKTEITLLPLPLLKQCQQHGFGYFELIKALLTGLNKTFFTLTLLVSVLLLSACSHEDNSNQVSFSEKSQVKGDKVYILGVHPLHNPSKLIEVYSPLADYLSESLPGARIQVEASKNYPSYDKKIEAERFDFSLPNPFQTINSLDNHYEVINQVGDSELFRGLILVRKDSNIAKVTQLTGHKIAYPAPTALAATMMPQYFLQTHGLDLKQTKTLYVGSQESSIMNVYLGHSKASATWTIPWLDLQKHQPEIAEQLSVAWKTEALPNNSFMYHRKKVPVEIALQVQDMLAQLHTHEKGKQLLERMNIRQIYRAENADYKPVVNFLLQFKKEIGDNHLLPSN